MLSPLSMQVAVLRMHQQIMVESNDGKDDGSFDAPLSALIDRSSGLDPADLDHHHSPS